MANKEFIYAYCGHCGGDGIEEEKSHDGSTVEVVCHQCLGSRKTLWGEIVKEE